MRKHTAPTEPLVLLREWAQEINWTEARLRSKVRRKQVPYTLIDGQYYFSRDVWRAWVAEQTIKPVKTRQPANATRRQSPLPDAHADASA